MVRSDGGGRRSRVSLYQGLQLSDLMMVRGGLESACIKACNGQARWLKQEV